VLDRSGDTLSTVEQAAEDGQVDRRALLRKAAAVGAVGWATPVILTSGPASAAAFTPKCAPGDMTAVATFAPVSCLPSSSFIDIRVRFTSACPCGNAGGRYCSQRNSPTPIVTGARNLDFRVEVPIGSLAISGKAARGCRDRDGDIQYAVYDWSMTAFDNGGPCGSAINSVSAVTLSNRALVPGTTACPPLNSFALASPSIASNGSPLTVRPTS
jgi:hypothetical protein